jgi:hypothetical protein
MSSSCGLDFFWNIGIKDLHPGVEGDPGSLLETPKWPISLFPSTPPPQLSCRRSLASPFVPELSVTPLGALNDVTSAWIQLQPGRIQGSMSGVLAGEAGDTLLELGSKGSPKHPPWVSCRASPVHLPANPSLAALVRCLSLCGGRVRDWGPCFPRVFGCLAWAQPQAAACLLQGVAIL